MQLAQHHYIISKYNYIFLLYYIFIYILIIKCFILNSYYFIDIKLQKLYCHFKYPLMYYLYHFLEKLEFNIEL